MSGHALNSDHARKAPADAPLFKQGDWGSISGKLSPKFIQWVGGKSLDEKRPRTQRVGGQILWVDLTVDRLGSRECVRAKLDRSTETSKSWCASE